MQHTRIYLVTGGAGFIGSHIVEALLKRGDRVRVLDNFSSGKMENLSSVIDRIELIRGDIRDTALVKQAAEGVSGILHQASLRSVPKSMTRPAEYNDVNVNGILSLLIAARDCGVKKFVFASSSSVYGNARSFPQKETDPVHPISPYSLTKRIGEEYCQLFSEVYGVSATALRYFNVYGPRQDLEDEYAVVIPKFINCLLRGVSPPVYGDGMQSRDFTFISDVVAANLAALDGDGGAGKVYNAAGGVSHSLLDLIATLNRILGLSLKPEFLPVRIGDVKKTHAAPERIREDLGWQARVSFEEGLSQTVEWYKRTCN